MEFFSTGVLFVLSDAEAPVTARNPSTQSLPEFYERLDESKAFVWVTLFPGTYRVQLVLEEGEARAEIPSDMRVQEVANVHFPTGRLMKMPNDDGIEVFAPVGSIPPGHYRATLHWSFDEADKRIHIVRSEYPEGDGPDGIIVLRRLQRDVWMGDVLEFFTRASSFTLFDEADAERSLGYAWTPAIAGTYFVHLGLEDRVTPSAEMKVLDRRNVRFKTGRLRQSSGDMIGTIPPGYYEAILYGSETAPSEDPERVVPDAVIVLRPRIPVG